MIAAAAAAGLKKYTNPHVTQTMDLAESGFIVFFSTGWTGCKMYHNYLSKKMLKKYKNFLEQTPILCAIIE